MKNTLVTDVKILRDKNDRAVWVHACDDNSMMTHLPLNIQHCACGASVHTSTAIRMPCIADLIAEEVAS